MRFRYACSNERRKDLAKQAGLNGIDYLEVLDGDAPPGSPPQRTLLVQFLGSLPAAIGSADLRVEGGSRVVGIGVEWAARAPDVDATVAGPAEVAFFNAMPDSVLVVRVDRYGDFSEYRFNMEAPGPGFDPELLATEFTFKAECPLHFDCATPDECPPEHSAGPRIDYLARDYASLRRLLLDRLSVLVPGWKD